MSDWSREEVEVIVTDYFAMLGADLARTPYNKTAHRRGLADRVRNRSEASIEFKHGNISAILIELGFPYIPGYKPRSNYQALLFDVVAERLWANRQLQELAATDADRPSSTPSVLDPLSILVDPPAAGRPERSLGERSSVRPVAFVDYLEREARNRSLGEAGEHFVIGYERIRLIRSGHEALAARIEHVSRVKGDAEGFDIRSYENDGKERLIEVKTTKYGQETPFFVSRNELAVSERRRDCYHVYRLFRFREAPRMFVLGGAISSTCTLDASTYVASVRAVL